MVYCISCESDVDTVVEPYSWNDAEALLFVYFILKSRESFSATARRAALPSVSPLVVGEHDFSIEFVCANFALNFSTSFSTNLAWSGPAFVPFGTLTGTIHGKPNRTIVVAATELTCEYGVLF